jgi:hypothetical protein
MAGRPAEEQRRVERADELALNAAIILALCEQLLQEAISQDNAPRVERILKVADAAERIRVRAVEAKQ